MKLITVATVVKRLGSDSGITIIENIIEEALHGATSYIEAALRFTFAPKSSQVDLFFVEGTEYDSSQLKTVLNLSQGFIDTSSVVAKYAGTVATVSSGTAITDYCHFSDRTAVQGIVTLLDQDIAKSYISITYDSGLAIDGVDTDLYDQDEVPQWLKEAAYYYVLNDLKTNDSVREEEISAKQSDMLMSRLQNTISPYIKYAPHAIHSVY